jgi:hypothetical protein
MNEEINGQHRISQPARRAELILYLRELADRDLQERLWIQHLDTPNASGIDEVSHFFFDDTEVGNEPFSQIGVCLRNSVEADSIAGLTALLDTMILRLGDRGSRDYMQDSAWNEVNARASAAHKLLIDNDTLLG